MAPITMESAFSDTLNPLDTMLADRIKGVVAVVAFEEEVFKRRGR